MKIQKSEQVRAESKSTNFETKYDELRCSGEVGT